MKQATTISKIGHLPVDSGQLIITDPAYILPMYGDAPPCTYEKFLAESHLLRPNETVRGCTMFSQAAHLYGFGGDGLYPIYAETDASGNLLAIRIDFTKPEPHQYPPSPFDKPAGI